MVQAVILCGGLGTRLREETEFRPKPMVRIGEQPILWHIMKIYEHYGITDFVNVLGYKSELIREYFIHFHLFNNDLTLELGNPPTIQTHRRANTPSWRITLADTGLSTLKGARLKRVEQYIEGDTFLMTYGDGVADIDIDALLAFHRGHGRIATVTGVPQASPFGELRVNGDTVEAFREKPKMNGHLVSGGFFAFNRGIFEYLSEDEDCDLEVGALERVARDGELRAYRHDGFWACMDTQRDVDHLNQLWDSGKAAWRRW